MEQTEGQIQGGMLEQQGRMYGAGVEEAIQDTAINTGNLPIQSAPTVMLFDSGSTHMFIAKAFVDRIVFSIKDLGYDLVVSTPARVIHTISECVHGVAVVI